MTGALVGEAGATVNGAVFGLDASVLAAGLVSIFAGPTFAGSTFAGSTFGISKLDDPAIEGTELIAGRLTDSALAVSI